MIVDKKNKFVEFHFSPFRWGWADVVMTPRGYHGHTMESVFAHYGFSDVLQVQGLTRARVNNGTWELEFRELNPMLIKAFFSPARPNTVSVRQFEKHPTPSEQTFPL